MMLLKSYKSNKSNIEKKFSGYKRMAHSRMHIFCVEVSDYMFRKRYITDYANLSSLLRPVLSHTPQSLVFHPRLVTSVAICYRLYCIL